MARYGFVDEVDGVAVGDKVRFTGWTDEGSSEPNLGISPGDVGTVTKAFRALIIHPSWDVDFPTQNREEFPDNVVLYPGEFELVEEES